MSSSKKSDRAGIKDCVKSLSKKVGRAIADYGMIQDGDKILVGVSGGKDSLLLLKTLWERRAFVPIRYDVLALYVDLGFGSRQEPRYLRFLKESGYPFIARRHRFTPRQKEDLSCFWCSWNRRRVLFDEARKRGFNKIALGHHKDDIVETILMNFFFEGEISAMAPKQEMFKGALHIIRPLAYVEERELKSLARLMKLPVCRCLCPNAGVTQRAAVRKIISDIEKKVPSVKSNIFRSLQRIKKEYLL